MRLRTAKKYRLFFSFASGGLYRRVYLLGKRRLKSTDDGTSNAAAHLLQQTRFLHVMTHKRARFRRPAPQQKENDPSARCCHTFALVRSTSSQGAGCENKQTTISRRVNDILRQTGPTWGSWFVFSGRPCIPHTPRLHTRQSPPII